MADKIHEAPITKKIMKKLKEMGVFRYKTHGAIDQQRGLPDIIVCHHGYFVGIEVKVPGKSATPLQALTIKQIQQAGGIAGVVHSWEETLELLATVPESPE